MPDRTLCCIPYKGCRCLYKSAGQVLWLLRRRQFPIEMTLSRTQRWRLQDSRLSEAAKSTTVGSLERRGKHW